MNKPEINRKIVEKENQLKKLTEERTKYTKLEQLVFDIRYNIYNAQQESKGAYNNLKLALDSSAKTTFTYDKTEKIYNDIKNKYNTLYNKISPEINNKLKKLRNEINTIKNEIQQLKNKLKEFV